MRIFTALLTFYGFVTIQAGSLSRAEWLVARLWRDQRRDALTLAINELLAFRLIDNKRYARAINPLRRAVEEDFEHIWRSYKPTPDNNLHLLDSRIGQGKESLMLKLGECLYRTGDVRGALSEFESIIRKSESHVAEALVGSSQCYLKMCQFDEALDNIDASIEKSPTPSAHYVRARILLKMGDTAGAVLAAEAAIELRHDYSDALLFLAWCHLKRDEPSQAAEWIREAERAGCTDNELNLVKGGLHAQQKQYSNAIAYLNRHITDTPDDTKARELLFSCHRDLGQKEMAAKVMDEIRDLDADLADKLLAEDTDICDN